ncbi:MAG: LPP20 family lipoprotein [Deltaproteobacteria bacterium]|nr:LPP20 family lipoprotein [Deltaproteobacteria bacterium]
MFGWGAITIVASLALSDPAPGWVSRKPHPKFPAEAHLVGLGSASLTGDEKRDLEAAEASARKDVLTQIQVSVKSVSEAFEKEEHKNGESFDTARFSEQTQQSVSGTLEGVRIVDSYVDSGSKTRYALAVLSRADAAAGLESAMGAADRAVRGAFDKAKSAQNGDVALRALLDAYSEAEKNESTLVLYRALTRKSPEILKTSAVREQVAAWVGTLRFTVKSGDNQPASTGQPLAEPVVFALMAGNGPVPEAPIRVDLDGQGSVTGGAKTDAEGLATVRVSEVKSNNSPEQHVLAAVDWPGWLVDRSSRLRAAAFGLTPVEARATYSFKTVATTRIAIAIEEKIVWKDSAKTEAPGSPIFAPKISALLASQGFDVRPGASFGGLSAAQLATASAADLKGKVATDAEVLITGTISADFMNRMCDNCPSFYKAAGSLRAVDTRTGKLVAETNEAGKKGVGTSDTSAGTRALEESAKERAPEIVKALLEALKR